MAAFFSLGISKWKKQKIISISTEAIKKPVCVLRSSRSLVLHNEHIEFLFLKS